MSFPCFSGIERRILGLLILFPFLGAMIFGTPYSYCVLTAISIMMGWELKSISGFLGFQGTLFASLIAISSLPFLVFGFSNQFEIAFTIAVLTSLFASTNCSLTVSIFAGFLSLCLSSSVAFLQIDEGNLKLVVLAIIIGASDSSAYFCGRFFGGPKLMPLVSPNKTVSGGLFGLLASVAVTTMFKDFLNLESLSGSIITGLLLGVLIQLGDLFESIVKRQLGVKDSGRMLFGHGGFLDRFDGYLFCVPATYSLLYVL